MANATKLTNMIRMSQAAKLFNISVNTLRNWKQNGTLPYIKEKNVLFVHESILASIIKNKGEEFKAAQKAAKKGIETRLKNSKKDEPIATKHTRIWLTQIQAADIFDIEGAVIWKYGKAGKIRTKKKKSSTRYITIYHKDDVQALAQLIFKNRANKNSDVIPVPGPHLSGTDGDDIFPKIKTNIINDIKTIILIDDSVDMVNPEFFELAVGRLYRLFPSEKIKKNLKIDGLSEDDMVVLRTIIFLAKRDCRAKMQK